MYIYRDIVEHYGVINQLDILVEECAELIQAVSKYKRSNYAKAELDHVAEEMADVQIMLRQIADGYGGLGSDFYNSINNWINVKTERQLRRINEEERNKNGE